MELRTAFKHIIITLAFFVCFTAFSCIQADAVSETGREDYEVMSGVTESTVYVTDGTKRNLRVHILRVQNGANASFKASYKGYYSEGSAKETRKAKAKKWSSKNAGYEYLRVQAEAYDQAEDTKGIVIAATNGDFYSRDGVPAGNLIMEGNKIYTSKKEPFFAVLKDGSIEIRDPGASTDGVVEAIGGSGYLVNNGEIVVEEGGLREPRQSIGICPDGTVVLVNVEGRVPETPGTVPYELASIMLQQGCVKAINLDGGGSASFLTKRAEDSELVFRNVPGDGIERSVSASLLVVDNNDGERKTKTGSPTVSMANEWAVFEGKEGGKYTYKIDGKGQTGFYTINGDTYLFDKGKGKSTTVRIGNVDYTFEKGALTEVSDPEAGHVIIGYCGSAPNGGRNLIYAYQYGNKTLNVGVNPLRSGSDGEMKNWIGNNKRTVPWYAYRSDIEKIYVGDGVTSIGKRFMHVPDTPIFYGNYAPESQLRSVRLPDSLKYIENNAFFNKPNLKVIYLPESLVSLGEDAFGSGNLKLVIYGGDDEQWDDVEGSDDVSARFVICGTEAA